MTLIADSGSTKTEWSLITDTGDEQRVFTQGINPYFTTTGAIAATLRRDLMPQLQGACIKAIRFYGAGCASPEKCAVVADALHRLYPAADVEVASDLLGACRSLLGRKAGIVGILGTGSNSCFYDGERILENISPLGFILGDEGSGAHLGKLLTGDVIKRQLPAHVCEAFLRETGMTPAVIVENVYRKPFPNRFLAAFAPFISRHLDEPSLYELAKSAFTAYLHRNVMNYDYPHYPLSLTGSVAYHFAELIRETAHALGITLAHITKSPMEGLIAYHNHTV